MSCNHLPKNFYWREYLVLHKDLINIKNKNEAIKHYLNHGIYEKREYKINKTNSLTLIPYDFDWEEYYLLYKDSSSNLKKTKKSCTVHYLLFGRNKQYKLNVNSIKNNKKVRYTNISDKCNVIDNINNNTNISDKYNVIDNINNNTNILNNEIDLTFKNIKKCEIVNAINYNDEMSNIDKIPFDDDNYDLLDESDIIYTKVSDKKYLQFESDIKILDVLPNYNLIIDMNNSECKDSFFINSIISKYKTHSTFLILRFDQEKYYFNINNEYILNQFYNETDDVITIIENIKHKITKIFVNSFISFNEKFIEYVLNLSIFKIGTTSDFFKIYKESLPFYEYINLINPNININKFDELINPNDYEYNLKLFSSFYHKDIKIVPFPHFNNKLKKFKTNNKEIICCLIGNFTEPNIKTELENIVLYFGERYKSINFVIFGNIDTKMHIDSEKYSTINEFNNLLTKYNPNVIINLGNYNTNYCDNLQLSFITDLPIIYSKKNSNYYNKHKLSSYYKSYEFESMDTLFYLINKHSQDYFYTILPIISFNRYWNDLWIPNKEEIILQDENNKHKHKHNINPYFIYYPQFHETIENNVIHYESYTDIKEINYYNEKNSSKLNVPNNEYCKLENYDYILNEKLVQQQINLINNLGFSGIAVYYYWFMINTITNNNMIMDNVINKLFSPDVDMYKQKIFFIWKNENLSDILNCGNKIIENVYNNVSFYKNGDCLMKYFKNDKYLKINNKPVFIINDSDIIKNVDILYNVLNKLCVENGFSGINLILNSNDKENNSLKNCQIYFNVNNIKNDLLDFKNNRNEIDYYKFVNNEYDFSSSKIQSITLDLDNSSNIKKHIKIKTPFVCKNNTEMLKILYIKKIIECYNKNYQTDLDKILLINSFNNWGEGNAFEPSEKYGYYNMNLLNKILKY